jgi:hypothetical protein
MTFLAKPWSQPVRRAARGISMLALTILLAACGGGIARLFADLMAAAATPNVLTMQPGTSSTFTLDIQCDAFYITLVDVSFPDPLPPRGGCGGGGSCAGGDEWQCPNLGV